MINIIRNNHKNNYVVYKGKTKLTSSKAKIKVYNKIIKCAHVLLKVIHNGKTMNLFGLFVLQDKYSIMKDKIFIKTNGIEYNLKYLVKIKIPKVNYIIIFYKTIIPYKDFISAPIHNKVVVIYKEKGGYGFYKRVKYNFLDKDKSKFKSTRLKKLKDINTAIFLRQSSNNTLFITARVINETDRLLEQMKINIAWYISKIKKRKNVILMYEKDALKYEESSSVLYEKLIDLKTENVYYVIDKNSKQVISIKGKYKKNIIYKNSLKNYLYFFYTKTFIGTEMPAHSISLRIKNKYVEQVLFEKNYNYVFLQHGVMYMVSLASKTRASFRKGKLMPKNSKIIVSSKEEARHFIEDGNFDEKDLYISGLPKFDNTYRNKTADKIIIMPTWRPWEYNQIRSDVKNTKYYKMLLEIVEGIPKKLKDKIIVLPHPLFIEAVSEENFPIKLPEYISYDELLRDCEILITDYSSIAYDAFFRESNVVFWWKEKDECMEEYQGYLCLNEKNIFGPICNNSKELRKVINKIYNNEQAKKYKNKYEKLVEFKDRKNTDRLVEFLKKDNLI